MPTIVQARMWRLCLALALTLACYSHTLAQAGNSDCNTAATLCAQQPLAGDNTAVMGSPGFCPGTGNVLWYSFTTNSVGGAAMFSVNNIDCPTLSGMDNELSLVVLSGNTNCDLSTFTAISSCAADSVDFSSTVVALQPNTTYWVVVAGAMNNGATIPAQCEFNLDMQGPAVDIVGIDFDAGDDIVIGEGESVQLQATPGLSNYLWTPSTGLSGDSDSDPIATPTQTTTYSVSTDLNGCTYTDQLVIDVIRLIVPPNTFTPNGDMANDTWEIFRLGIDYPSCEVLVYDRWGQRVFRSIGYNEPWNGTNKGKKLPTATYYYVIQLNKLEGDSPPYTGSITIVR